MDEEELLKLQMEDSKSLLQKQQEADEERKRLLREQLAERIKAAQIPSIDWTPLAAQLDSLAGGKTAQIAAASNLAQTQGAQQKIDELLAAQLAGGGKSSNLSTSDLYKQAEIKGRFQESQVKSAFKDVSGNLIKQTKELTDINSALSQVEEALKTGKRSEILAKLSLVAKSINKEAGALSEGDVSRQIWTTLADDLNQLASRVNGTPGELNPESINMLARSVASSRANTAKAYRDRTNLMVSTYQGNPTYKTALEQAQSGIANFNRIADETQASKFVPVGNVKSTSQYKAKNTTSEDRAEKLKQRLQAAKQKQQTKQE